MKADNDTIIRNEILRSLLQGPKRRKDLSIEVWPRIKQTGISKGSFQSVILNRKLESLKEGGWIDKPVDKPKNVTWELRKDAKERAKMAVNETIDDLKRSFTECLKCETKQGEHREPLIKIFQELSFPLMSPFWIKIFKAIKDKNQTDFLFYKEEGGKRLSALFETTAEMLQTEEYAIETEFLALSWEYMAESELTPEHRWYELLKHPENKKFYVEWVQQKTKEGKEWSVLLPEAKAQYLRQHRLTAKQMEFVGAIVEVDPVGSLEFLRTDLLKMMSEDGADIDKITESVKHLDIMIDYFKKKQMPLKNKTGP